MIKHVKTFFSVKHRYGTVGEALCSIKLRRPVVAEASTGQRWLPNTRKSGIRRRDGRGGMGQHPGKRKKHIKVESPQSNKKSHTKNHLKPPKTTELSTTLNGRFGFCWIFETTNSTSQGAVDASVGAKRVLHEALSGIDVFGCFRRPAFA